MSPASAPSAAPLGVRFKEDMKHSIEIKDDGFAYVTIIGDGDAVVAQEFVDTAEKIFNEHNNIQVDALVDMTESGYSTYDGIEIYKKFLKDDRLKRIAFVIPDSAVAILVRMAIGDRERETKIFSTRPEAESWLKHENNEK